MRTRKTIATLQARIDQLEAQVASGNQETQTSRRGMLRMAGAAAVGGLAAVVTADPVAATDGAAVLAGVTTNSATLPTAIEVAVGPTDFGIGCYEAGTSVDDSGLSRPAVVGLATGATFLIGVAGFSSGSGSAVYGRSSFGSGHGVVGDSENATGVVAASTFGTQALDVLCANGVGGRFYGARGAIKIAPTIATPPPLRATTYGSNTLEADTNNSVWFCYESGLPGKWRKLAGPATAGAFHAITPTRVYDSRAAAPSPGLLAAGDNRLISVADGRDSDGTITTPNLVPAGATAVAANVTVTGTTGAFGYLTVNPGGVTTVSASTINWFGALQNLANGVTLTLNATREVTVICGSDGGDTHFIIDISGYYL